MKIVVLDGYTLNPGDNPWDGVAKLGDLTVHDRTAPEEILSRAKGADILLTNKTPLTRATIDALDTLKFISVLATGYNVVDGAAARARGIPISNVPTYGTRSVAQHTFALLLELCHRVGPHDQSVRAGDWSSQPDFCYWKSPQLELTGRTLGVVGFGRIGQQVARIGEAFGMKIAYHDKATIDYPGATRLTLDELARQSDVITLHCALTAENKEFINRNFLSQVKPTCFLLNTARGGLIHESDLADALKEGKLGGAALDVLQVEPPPKDHPLFCAPRILFTPHIAWASQPARRTLTQITENNIAAFLKGTPINVVNP